MIIPSCLLLKIKVLAELGLVLIFALEVYIYIYIAAAATNHSDAIRTLFELGANLNTPDN